MKLCNKKHSNGGNSDDYILDTGNPAKWMRTGFQIRYFYLGALPFPANGKVDYYVLEALAVKKAGVMKQGRSER